MQFIYLHGFNSAFDPNANKVASLLKLGKVVGITYDTFASYEEIFEYISSQVSECIDEIVFVGTSLGGYWAAQMAKHFGTPSIIINPCYDPGSMLRRYQDETMTNYYTLENKSLSEETIDTYSEKYIFGSDYSYKYLPLVLLDMGDEVINSLGTSQVLAGFPMLQFGGGSHRFDHMEESLSKISDYVSFCEYVEHLDA